MASFHTEFQFHECYKVFENFMNTGDPTTLHPLSLNIYIYISTYIYIYMYVWK